MKEQLTGKVAIVTGGARGIGEAHVRKLVEHGVRVVFTDVRVTEGEALAAELNGNATFLEHDVANEHAWHEVVAAAEATYGPVNILVNNAGISIKGTIEELSVDDYRRVIEVNQIGVFLGMQAVVPSMKRAGGGSIINISSILGIAGRAASMAYVSTKFAMNGMTKCAALELAPYKIRVNSVHPGSIHTALTETVYPTKELFDERANDIPIGRFGQADDIANTVLFLASNYSSYATGAEIVVDGGLLARI